jgi:hypothetical protein
VPPVVIASAHTAAELASSRRILGKVSIAVGQRPPIPTIPSAR